MEDLTFTTQASFLHHGIEGQKWGVRNGPPYPLDRENSKRIVREKKEKLIEAQQKLRNTKLGKTEEVGTAVALALKIPYLTAILSSVGENMSDATTGSERLGTLLGGAIAWAATGAIGVGEGKIVRMIRSTFTKNDKINVEYDKVKKEVNSAKEEYKAAKKYVSLANSVVLTPSQMNDLKQYANAAHIKLDKANKNSISRPKNENKLSPSQERIKNSSDFKKLYEAFGSGADDKEYFDYVKETELGIKSPISMEQYNEIAEKIS